MVYLPQACIILPVEVEDIPEEEEQNVWYLPQACIILPVEVEEDIPEEEGTCSINGF